MNNREGIPGELRILLLEDNQSDAELILCAVREGGIPHVSRCVSAGDEFQQALTEFRPNLVLSDYELPGLNGTEALAIVRAQDPDLPFIIITGALGDELAVETIKQGATDYILKDRLSRLVPAILRAMRETEQRNQRRQAQELVKRQHRTLEAHHESLKKAARDLEAAHKRYARLYDTAPVGYASLSAEGIIHELNSAFARMIGRERAQLIDTAFTLYVAPADVNKFAEHLGKCRQGPGAVRTELALTVFGHEPITVELFSVSVHEPEEQTTFFQTAITDITARQQAEEQARRLADAVQSTQELISITDDENRFTFVNQAFLRAYGYCESEVLGRTPDFLYASANPEGLCEQVFQQTVRAGWRGEILNRRKDGTEFPISLSTSPIKSSAGKTIGLMGVARDISERKRAEKQSAAFALLGRRLSGAASPEQAACLILDIASELFGWDAGYLHLYSRSDDKIIPVLTVDTVEGLRTPIAPDTFTLDPSPLMRAVMKLGARLINREEDAPAPVRLVPFGDSQRRSASMMYVPIHTRGMLLGILSIQSYTPHAYSPEDLQLLQILADHCGEALLRIEVSGAMMAAEAKYQSIFENATEGIFQITPEGRYRSANPALARMLGHQTPEALMSSVTDVWRQTYVAPEKAAELKRLLDTQGFVQGFEAERYRMDGSKIWTSINGRAARDAHGAVLYYEGTNQDITARKQAEAVLRESEARLRLLNEQVPAILWTTDCDLRITSSTGSALATLNLKTNELAGRLLSEYFGTTDDAFPGLVAHRRALDGERSVLEMEWGGRVWRANIEPLADAGGRVVGCIGAALDITDAKKAEERLRVSEQQFRQVTEAIREVFWMTNVEKTEVIYVSPGYEAIWGRSCASLHAKPREWVDAIHPDDRDRVLQAAVTKQVGGQYDEEYRVVRPDGSERWIRDRAFPVRDPTGRICRIAGIAEDITGQKRAEQALRQSERKLRLISENTTDVIFAFDMNRRPLYVNSAVEKLTGYNFGEIEKKGFINWIHPADQERMLRHWEELYAGKAYHDVEFRLITKTGQVKWCSSTWGPILDEQGRQLGVQGREQDITARKELEREVLETSANVRRNIGHELHDGLGQYLAGIALKTKALEESLAAEGAAQTRTAKQVVRLLNNAIGQTRSLAHGLDPVHVEADGLVAALEKLTAQSAELLGVQCDFACNQKRLAVNAQAGLALYRIAQEAMHNAVKHGQARRIEVELEVDAVDLCLRIRDNGCGFAPAATPNAGMGLRIMQYRASSIGGTLKIRSAPKQGTQAECRVPRQSWQADRGHPAPDSPLKE